MNGREGVQRLRVLLTPEKAWTKGASARDDFGSQVPPTSPAATCYCLIGGAYKVTGGGDCYVDARELLIRQLEQDDMFAGLSQFNDSIVTDHADVLAFLDRVLA